jgi:hypothetical protein
MATAAKELSMSKTNVEVPLSVWFLNHTASKWYNCQIKITGASLISVKLQDLMSSDDHFLEKMQFSDIPRQRCSKCSRQNMGL